MLNGNVGLQKLERLQRRLKKFRVERLDFLSTSLLSDFCGVDLTNVVDKQGEFLPQCLREALGDDVKDALNAGGHDEEQEEATLEDQEPQPEDND